MPILFSEEEKIFTIHTDASTYQMKVDHLGFLIHLYYGARTEGNMDFLLTYMDRGFSGNPYDLKLDRTYSLDALPQEFPLWGQGDYRSPALNVRDGEGTFGCDLRFAGYAVVFIRREIERALQHESTDKMLESRSNGQTRSLDAPLGAKPNVNLLQVLTDGNSPMADGRTYSSALEQQVEHALEELNERERQVVAAYFGIGQEHLTMAEIAEDMGLKRERVRQIRDRAVRRMRKAMRS